MTDHICHPAQQIAAPTPIVTPAKNAARFFMLYQMSYHDTKRGRDESG